MRTPRNAAQPAGPVYDHKKTMASFSTIPEQQPLLDEARPKQRKFAATTVAVLCLASAAVAASVPAAYRAMTLDSTPDSAPDPWQNDMAYFQLRGTDSCLGVKNHNKATVGSPLVLYTCDMQKHIGQSFLCAAAASLEFTSRRWRHARE